MCLNTCLVKKTCCDPLANGLKLVSHVFYIQYRFAAAEMLFLLFFVHSWIKGSRAYKMGDEVKKEFDPFGQLHGLFETVLNLVVLPKPQLSVFEVLPVD